MNLTKSDHFNHATLVKVLLVVVLSLCICTSRAQKKKLVAAGTPANFYLDHEVAPGETFNSIAGKYNIPAKKLAFYNNLDYYAGKLFTKFLKVPLTEQNFVKVEDVINAGALTPIYKYSKGKPIVIGFLQEKATAKPVPNFAKIKGDNLTSTKN
jgi:LysM repeat protein